MRWLIFLSKVAFLSGLVMLAAFSLLFVNWNQGEVVSSSIFTAGYALAIILIPVVNLLYFLFWIIRRKTKVPAWLVFINFLFLMVLALYIFFLNDPYYFQK